MKADILDRALAAERGRKGFSAEQRDALWKGIDASVGLAPPAPAPDPPAAPPSPPSAVPAATGLGSLKVAALVAVAALGGAGVGALAHAQWATPQTVIVERAAPGAVPAPTAPPTPAAELPVPAPTPPVPVATAVAPSRAAPPSASVAPAAKDPALARERALLDMARTALARGDASSALSTLDLQAREFPKSQLAEEREVLAVQALAAVGRLPEARRRAAAFKASYPRSALLTVIEEAVQ